MSFVFPTVFSSFGKYLSKTAWSTFLTKSLLKYHQNTICICYACLQSTKLFLFLELCLSAKPQVGSTTNASEQCHQIQKLCDCSCPALYENCRSQKIKILPWLGSFFNKEGKGGREPWEDQKNRLAVYRNTSYVSLTLLKLFIVKAEKCPRWHSFLPCCQGGGQRQDFPLHLPVSFYIQALSKLLMLPQQRPWTFKAVYRNRPLASINMAQQRGTGYPHISLCRTRT